jgi:hypothetical protein
MSDPGGTHLHLPALDRYGHLLPGTEERVTDALDAMATSAIATTTRVPHLAVVR